MVVDGEQSYRRWIAKIKKWRSLASLVWFTVFSLIIWVAFQSIHRREFIAPLLSVFSWPCAFFLLALLVFLVSRIAITSASIRSRSITSACVSLCTSWKYLMFLVGVVLSSVGVVLLLRFAHTAQPDSWDELAQLHDGGVLYRCGAGQGGCGGALPGTQGAVQMTIQERIQVPLERAMLPGCDGSGLQRPTFCPTVVADGDGGVRGWSVQMAFGSGSESSASAVLINDSVPLAPYVMIGQRESSSGLAQSSWFDWDLDWSLGWGQTTDSKSRATAQSAPQAQNSVPEQVTKPAAPAVMSPLAAIERLRRMWKAATGAVSYLFLEPLRRYVCASSTEPIEAGFGGTVPTSSPSDADGMHATAVQLLWLSQDVVVLVVAVVVWLPMYFAVPYLLRGGHIVRLSAESKVGRLTALRRSLWDSLYQPFVQGLRFTVAVWVLMALLGGPILSNGVLPYVFRARRLSAVDADGSLEHFLHVSGVIDQPSDSLGQFVLDRIAAKRPASIPAPQDPRFVDFTDPQAASQATPIVKSTGDSPFSLSSASPAQLKVRYFTEDEPGPDPYRKLDAFPTRQESKARAAAENELLEPLRDVLVSATEEAKAREAEKELRRLHGQIDARTQNLYVVGAVGNVTDAEAVNVGGGVRMTVQGQLTILVLSGHSGAYSWWRPLSLESAAMLFLTSFVCLLLWWSGSALWEAILGQPIRFTTYLFYGLMDQRDGFARAQAFRWLQHMSENAPQFRYGLYGTSVREWARLSNSPMLQDYIAGYESSAAQSEGGMKSTMGRRVSGSHNGPHPAATLDAGVDDPALMLPNDVFDELYAYFCDQEWARELAGRETRQALKSVAPFSGARWRQSWALRQAERAAAAEEESADDYEAEFFGEDGMDNSHLSDEGDSLDRSGVQRLIAQSTDSRAHRSHASYRHPGIEGKVNDQGIESNRDCSVLVLHGDPSVKRNAVAKRNSAAPLRVHTVENLVADQPTHRREAILSMLGKQQARRTLHFTSLPAGVSMYSVAPTQWQRSLAQVWRMLDADSDSGRRVGHLGGTDLFLNHSDPLNPGQRKSRASSQRTRAEAKSTAGLASTMPLRAFVNHSAGNDQADAPAVRCAYSYMFRFPDQQTEMASLRDSVRVKLFARELNVRLTQRVSHWANPLQTNASEYIQLLPYAGGRGVESHSSRPEEDVLTQHAAAQMETSASMMPNTLASLSAQSPSGYWLRRLLRCAAVCLPCLRPAASRRSFSSPTAAKQLRVQRGGAGWRSRFSAWVRDMCGPFTFWAPDDVGELLQEDLWRSNYHSDVNEELLHARAHVSEELLSSSIQSARGYSMRMVDPHVRKYLRRFAVRSATVAHGSRLQSDSARNDAETEGRRGRRRGGARRSSRRTASRSNRPASGEHDEGNSQASLAEEQLVYGRLVSPSMAGCHGDISLALVLVKDYFLPRQACFLSQFQLPSDHAGFVPPGRDPTPSEPMTFEAQRAASDYSSYALDSMGGRGNLLNGVLGGNGESGYNLRSRRSTGGRDRHQNAAGRLYHRFRSELNTSVSQDSEDVAPVPLVSPSTIFQGRSSANRSRRRPALLSTSASAASADVSLESEMSDAVSKSLRFNYMHTHRLWLLAQNAWDYGFWSCRIPRPILDGDNYAEFFDLQLSNQQSGRTGPPTYLVSSRRISTNGDNPSAAWQLMLRYSLHSIDALTEAVAEYLYYVQRRPVALRRYHYAQQRSAIPVDSGRLARLALRLVTCGMCPRRTVAENNGGSGLNTSRQVAADGHLGSNIGDLDAGETWTDRLSHWMNDVCMGLLYCGTFLGTLNVVSKVFGGSAAQFLHRLQLSSRSLEQSLHADDSVMENNDGSHSSVDGMSDIMFSETLFSPQNLRQSPQAIGKVNDADTAIDPVTSEGVDSPMHVTGDPDVTIESESESSDAYSDVGMNSRVLSPGAAGPEGLQGRFSNAEGGAFNDDSGIMLPVPNRSVRRRSSSQEDREQDQADVEEDTSPMSIGAYFLYLLGLIFGAVPWVVRAVVSIVLFVLLSVLSLVANMVLVVVHPEALLSQTLVQRSLWAKPLRRPLGLLARFFRWVGVHSQIEVGVSGTPSDNLGSWRHRVPLSAGDDSMTQLSRVHMYAQPSMLYVRELFKDVYCVERSCRALHALLRNAVEEDVYGTVAPSVPPIVNSLLTLSDMLEQFEKASQKWVPTSVRAVLGVRQLKMGPVCTLQCALRDVLSDLASNVLPLIDNLALPQPACERLNRFVINQ